MRSTEHHKINFNWNVQIEDIGLEKHLRVPRPAARKYNQIQTVLTLTTDKWNYEITIVVISYFCILSFF